MKDFQGKVALVTGGTSGIGRAAAVAFAREGAKVVVAGRRAVEGEDTVRLIREQGGEGIFLPTDVTQEPQVINLVGRTLERFGRLDFAFNNEEVLEGPEVEGVVIISFPSFKEAKAWYDSPAYREAREHRFRGADYRAVIVEGV